MNKVIIVGNLTRDPELRSTPSGIATCTFTIAVNRPRAKEGAQQVDFLPVVAWRSTAESCAKYLSKGRKVGVAGSIQTRSYEAKDGTKRHVTEIVADEVEFLSSSSQQQGTIAAHAPSEHVGPHGTRFTQANDEELPY